jgi:hypothetical protein
MLYACKDWRYIAHVNPNLYAENVYYTQRVETVRQAAARMGEKLPPMTHEMGETMEGRLKYLATLGFRQEMYTRGTYRGSNEKHALVHSLYS